MSLFSKDPHSEGPPPSPRASATVLVARDTPSGTAEIFMVRRHGKSGFMAGAHVFPGGTVDDADRDPAFLDHISGVAPALLSEELGEEGETSPEDAVSIYVSAIRETLEEAGVFLGTETKPDVLSAGRAALLSGEPFLDILTRWGAELTPARLVPLARWVTPNLESRRYDARFFLARLPEGQRAAHDDIETTAGAWMTPDDALSRAAAGDIQLPPPTLRTLFHLRDFRTVDALLSDAGSRRPPRLQPEVTHSEDRLVLALPGDPAHSEPHPAFPGPTRVVLAAGRWSLEPMPGAR